MQMRSTMVSRAGWMGMFFLFLLFGCRGTGTKGLNGEDYLLWYQSAGESLNKMKEFGAVQVALHYKPNPVQYLEEKARKEEVKVEDYKDFTLFNLQIREKDHHLLYPHISVQMDRYSFISYYSFDFQKSIRAVQNGVEYSSEMYHYLKTLEEGKSLDFMIGFIGLNTSEPFDLIITDDVFGNGKIKYHYTPSFFNQLPTLKS